MGLEDAEQGRLQEHAATQHACPVLTAPHVMLAAGSKRKAATDLEGEHDAGAGRHVKASGLNVLHAGSSPAQPAAFAPSTPVTQERPHETAFAPLAPQHGIAAAALSVSAGCSITVREQVANSGDADGAGSAPHASDVLTEQPVKAELAQLQLMAAKHQLHPVQRHHLLNRALRLHSCRRILIARRAELQ